MLSKDSFIIKWPGQYISSYTGAIYHASHQRWRSILTSPHIHRLPSTKMATTSHASGGSNLPYCRMGTCDHAGNWNGVRRMGGISMMSYQQIFNISVPPRLPPPTTQITASLLTLELY